MFAQKKDSDLIWICVLKKIGKSVMTTTLKGTMLPSMSPTLVVDWNVCKFKMTMHTICSQVHHPMPHFTHTWDSCMCRSQHSISFCFLIHQLPTFHILGIHVCGVVEHSNSFYLLIHKLVHLEYGTWKWKFMMSKSMCLVLNHFGVLNVIARR